MAEIVLFHSVLGIRQGVRDAAAQIEAMGHVVHVPSLYDDGTVFDDYEAAIAYMESVVTYPGLIARTNAAVASLPANVVYAGFSNGGTSAEYLAATRPGALGALLFSAALPLEMFAQVEGVAAAPSWPRDVPVQVHYTVGDPFREQAFLDSFTESVRGAGASFALFEYPGTGHLFTDATLPQEYDAPSAALLWERVERFLDALPT